MTTTHRDRTSLANTSRRAVSTSLDLFLILGFAAMLSTPAQPSTRNHNEISSAPTAGAPETQPSRSEELVALRAQLDVMRQYDQRLLSTVYWSLSVVVTLAVGLIAIIGLFNLRIYERDKAALRQDLVGFLNQELAKSQQAFRQEIAAFQKDIQTALAQGRDSIAEVSREAAESVVTQLRGQLDALDHRVTKVQFELAEMEAKAWKSTGVYSNALRANLKMLEIARKLGYDFLIAASLEDMQFSLKAIVAKNAKSVDAGLAKDISEGLDGLPNTLAIETGIITGLVQKARS